MQMVPSNNPHNPSGYSFPDNDNVFKQNQLKLSVNASVNADIEKFRYKELVDSFLTDEKIEWVDTLLQCVQGYDEINQEILRVLEEEIENENVDRKSRNVAELKIDYNAPICLTPTVHKAWAESKNICQLSKSRHGIAVRTASTQRLVHDQRSTLKEKIEGQEKKGIMGSFHWRKQPETQEEIYG